MNRMELCLLAAVLNINPQDEETDRYVAEVIAVESIQCFSTCLLKNCGALKNIPL